MTDHADVDSILDSFHAAAAVADEPRYLATLTDDMVFLGTAPGERWEGPAWREFVHRYFSQGKGWSYAPSDRRVVIAPGGETAWFDETVDNDHFGACRGSGVLRREGDGWRIAHYNLTIPIPDELVPDLVSRIREMRPA